MTYCHQCSTENEDGSVRCHGCGAPLKEIDRSTRKIRRDALPPSARMRLEAAEKAERQAEDPPTERMLPAPAPPRTVLPPPPPPPPTILLDWAAEGALVSEILDAPYALTRASAVTIGRTDENNIVMPVHQVSRQHALVKWDGEGFVIIDRNSTNGTYVNGEPVQRRRLRAGDRIGVGPFELFYQQGLGAPAEKGPTSSTVVVALPGAFSGALTEISVPEICQLMELNQKTGLLVLHEGESRGKLYFSAGRAVHAEYRDLLGDEAALELLTITKGTFRFFARESVTVQPTVKRPTSSLLLEAARRIDESATGGPLPD